MSDKKRLSLLDCVAIGINGIVGSGIFVLPNWVAMGAGSLGPLAFVVCGALCLLIGLCFAEVSGMFERSGGPYLYAREAFGETVGFGVGWMTFASAIIGYASIARSLGETIASNASLPAWAPNLIAPAFMLLLGALNYRGVKTGAATSDLLSFAKIVPLVLFAIVGIFAVKGSTFASHGMPDVKGFAAGTFSCVFALTGFEFVTVVAGETENPRRNIPIALISSLIGAVVLYALIQTVATGTLPNLAHHSDAPLAASATLFAGPWAGRILTVAQYVSMTGFIAGSALVVPRFISALADDGILPRPLSAMHPKLGTPTRSIVFCTGLAMLFAATFPFKLLADLTVITIFAQYVPTCLAVLVFRRTRPDAPRSFRIPFGPVIPVLATVSVTALLSQIEAKQLLTGGGLLALGAVVLVGNKLRAKSQPAL